MTNEQFISRLSFSKSYYIHCDLVRKDLNLNNGEISGNPQERVTYSQNFQNNSCHAEPLQFANTVTLTVKDENANAFDFLGASLHFELEII